jgi:hypothetical protein
VTALLDHGHYNCLSSAMTYVVLARAFGLQVRGALVPSHVFVELTTAGGKRIDVETTSPTGFDWVHDAHFYSAEAGHFSQLRGLPPVTYDDYLHRKLVEPYQLMASAMRAPAPDVGETDRWRLIELSALIDPSDADLALDRLRVYNNESVALFNANAWRTLAKLGDTIHPAVREIAARVATTRELVSWVDWHYAHALMIVGRFELKQNHIDVVEDRFNDLAGRKDDPAAAVLFTAHRDACLASASCQHNAGVIYANWSIDNANAGNWPAVRQVLEDCVAAVPGYPDRAAALKDLEARHQF